MNKLLTKELFFKGRIFLSLKESIKYHTVIHIFKKNRI